MDIIILQRFFMGFKKIYIAAIPAVYSCGILYNCYLYPNKSSGGILQVSAAALTLIPRIRCTDKGRLANVI